MAGEVTQQIFALIFMQDSGNTAAAKGALLPPFYIDDG
jgi:hypothetical protein